MPPTREQLGPEPPDGTVFLAPLAGYTDIPFRMACRRCGCSHAYTPMVDAGALVYGNRKNARILARHPDEPWLGTQLIGSEPDLLARAAAMLDAMEFDVIDFNLGCPVRKMVAKGAGAALGRLPDAAARAAETVVRHAPRHRVSAKVRILDSSDPAPTVAAARKLEAAGIRSLTVHGRVMERAYSGPVACDIIAAVRESVSIPVVANGGVFDRESAAILRRETGCRDIMVARGAIGNPWIFRELAEPTAGLPSHAEVCEIMREHVLGMIDLYGESTALRNARKIILAYLVGRGYPRPLRARVTGIATLAAFEDLYRDIVEEGPTPAFHPDEGHRRRGRSPIEDG